MHHDLGRISRKRMGLSEAGGAGLTLDPQHPVTTKRQFKIMAALVGTADFAGADKLDYRKFDANAPPTRTAPRSWR